MNRALNVCNAMNAKVMNNFESEVVRVIEALGRSVSVDEVASAMRFKHSGVSERVVSGALKTLVANGKLSEIQGVFRLRR